MANDFIHPDTSITTTTHGQRLIQFVDLLRRVINAADELKGIMDHMTDDVTFTTIETRFGLAVGQGTTVRTLVTNCRSAVRSPSTLEAVDRIG